ncbi:MAG TPA: sigma-70 family RNA polymerase sigma factor [Blastocatellia bacterium]|nr:sigma-70 family RNA polymerase sigma factor [Blastocatellia bacterium]
MLAEKEALLVAGLEKFGSSELMVPELALQGESPPAGQACPYEAALIARLKVGEMGAFDQLVAEYQALVYALALRVLGDAEDARDATQETFLKVYRHFARFRGEASLKTWICRIAINQARSTERWWRRRRRSETTSLDTVVDRDEGERLNPGAYLASAAATPEAAILSRERERQLELALTKLKRDFRIAVILRDIEGLAYDEIAYVTGVSIGTVKSRIARGREMLRELVQPRDRRS